MPQPKQGSDFHVGCLEGDESRFPRHLPHQCKQASTANEPLEPQLVPPHPFPTLPLQPTFPQDNTTRLQSYHEDFLKCTKITLADARYVKVMNYPLQFSPRVPSRLGMLQLL